MRYGWNVSEGSSTRVVKGDIVIFSMHGLLEHEPKERTPAEKSTTRGFFFQGWNDWAVKFNIFVI